MEALGVLQNASERVGAGSLLLGGGRVDAALGHRRDRQPAPGDEVNQIAEVAHPSAHRARRVVAVTHPRRVPVGIEGPIGQVVKERLPVSILLFDLPLVVIPIHYLIPGITTKESTLKTPEEWLKTQDKVQHLQHDTLQISPADLPKNIEIWTFS